MDKFDYYNEKCVYNTLIPNLSMNSDFETFTFPDLDITGTTKISTGLTISSVGVYELPGQINVKFSITGNTTSFNKIDKFGYKVLKFDESTSGFTDTVYTKEVNINDFVFYEFLDSIPTNSLQYTGDNEYIINPYYKFSGITQPAGIDNFYSTEEMIFPNLEYNNYSPQYSHYFSIYNQPQNILNPIGEVRVFDGTYNYERLDIVSAGQTEFFISKSPTKIINLNLNGLSLLYGDEILGEVEFTNDLNKIVIKSGLTALDDVITIQYIADDNEPEFYVDSFYVNNLTGRVILNSGTTKYEFLLENTPQSNITLNLNGLKLNEGVDFYKSVSNPRNLIFHDTSIEVGDTLIALYQTDFEIGNVYSSAVTINFQTTLEQEEGEFLLEVTDFTDTDFLNPIFSATTDYSFLNTYDVVKGETYDYFLTFSPVQINQTYLARLKNTKQIPFITYTIDVSSFSEIISFKAGDNSVESY